MKTETVTKIIRLSSYKYGGKTKYCVQKYDGQSTIGAMWSILKRGTLDEIIEFVNGEEFNEYEKVLQL